MPDLSHMSDSLAVQVNVLLDASIESRKPLRLDLNRDTTYVNVSSWTHSTAVDPPARPVKPASRGMAENPLMEIDHHDDIRFWQSVQGGVR